MRILLPLFCVISYCSVSVIEVPPQWWVGAGFGVQDLAIGLRPKFACCYGSVAAAKRLAKLAEDPFCCICSCEDCMQKPSRQHVVPVVWVAGDGDHLRLHVPGHFYDHLSYLLVTAFVMKLGDPEGAKLSVAFICRKLVFVLVDRWDFLRSHTTYRDPWREEGLPTCLFR